MIRCIVRIICLDHGVKEMRDSSILSEFLISQMTKTLFFERICDLQCGSGLDPDHDVLVDNNDVSSE